jgi:plastocyanin
MKTLAAILLAGVGVAAAASVARPASTDGSLQASVGPGFSISLSQNGARVTRLDPGTYTISVNDQSSEHDFHLAGPGVDEATDIGGTGQTTWTVTFQNGTYTYVCDAHATTMRGTFTVGSAPAATTTATPAPAPLKLRIASARFAKPKTVIARVTANRRAAITATLWNGKTKLATAHATGTAATVRLAARSALKRGSYVVKATSGGASATKVVSVR